MVKLYTLTYGMLICNKDFLFVFYFLLFEYVSTGRQFRTGTRCDSIECQVDMSHILLPITRVRIRGKCDSVVAGKGTTQNCPSEILNKT